MTKKKTEPKTPTPKDDSLFQHLENLYTKAKPVGTVGGKFDPYMIQRFLSCNAGGFWPSQSSNIYANKLPDWAVERLLRYLTPTTNKAPRNSYVKKQEEEVFSTKGQKELVNKLAFVLNCSTIHAKQTYLLLEQQGIDIAATFGRDK